MKFHINCDMGEGIENEHELMPFIDSCSIACGGHYGTFITVDETIKLAIQHKVKIGAHPSFPDLAGFGRRELSFPYNLLVKSLIDQLTLFLMVAKVNEVEIDHVKAHGALYNLAMKSEFHADALLEAIQNVGLTCPVYGNGRFFIDRAFAQNQIPIIKEVFGDRRYCNDGTLVPRTEEKACIEHGEEAWNQILGVSQNQEMQAIDHKTFTIEADTFCIHGDNPHALEILKFIDERKKEI